MTNSLNRKSHPTIVYQCFTGNYSVNQHDVKSTVPLSSAKLLHTHRFETDQQFEPNISRNNSLSVLQLFKSQKFH